MKSTIDLVAECLPTLDEAISRSNVKDGGVLDGRDATRLAEFVPESRFAEIGVKLDEGGTHTPTEWNAENVSKQLASDVEFAFQKALDKRGISASLMSGVLGPRDVAEDSRSSTGAAGLSAIWAPDSQSDGCSVQSTESDWGSFRRRIAVRI